MNTVTTSPDLTKPIACYVLTRQGLQTAQKLAKQLPLVIFAIDRLRTNTTPTDTEQVRFFSTLAPCVADNFFCFHAHLFCTATGIAVRAIAPHLKHKSTDPTVLVMEQHGAFVIPLIAGHWGGGNALSKRVALLCHGQAVITTATDSAGLPAIDMLAKKYACTPLDWHEVKGVNATLLAGNTIPLYDPHHIFLQQDVPETYFTLCNTVPTQGTAVLVDWMAFPQRANLLRLVPKRLSIGVGCRRGVTAKQIITAIQTICHASGIRLEAVQHLASIDAKQNEQGLLQAASQLNLPIQWFSAHDLTSIPVPHPSSKASAVFKTPALGVCEGAALKAAGTNSQLILPKHTFLSCITLACAAQTSFFPLRTIYE